MKISRTIAISGVLFAAIALPTIATAGGPGQYPPPSPPPSSGGSGGGTVHGAPGPIAGAGLPLLGIGYGAYWLLRRYRRKSENASS
jgi:hypothetical protein